MVVKAVLCDGSVFNERRRAGGAVRVGILDVTFKAARRTQLYLGGQIGVSVAQSTPNPSWFD
jgi:hypothetical protein